LRRRAKAKTRKQMQEKKSFNEERAQSMTGPHEGDAGLVATTRAWPTRKGRKTSCPSGWDLLLSCKKLGEEVLGAGTIVVVDLQKKSGDKRAFE